MTRQEFIDGLVADSEVNKNIEALQDLRSLVLSGEPIDGPLGFPDEVVANQKDQAIAASILSTELSKFNEALSQNGYDQLSPDEWSSYSDTNQFPPTEGPL